MGFAIKNFKDYTLKLTMQGMERLNPYISKQARAVTPDTLIAIHQQLNHQDPRDAVFWVACLMAFFLLFRKSNLLPNTKTGFDFNKQLCRSDLVFRKDSIITGIRWAKNHQFSRELLTFPLPILNNILCPKRAILNMFQLNEGSPDGNLFGFPDGSSLTYPQFQGRLRGVLAAAGFEDPAQFSSHSFRRGGASFAFLCGVPAELIKVLGNWKSDCYMKYLHFPLESRLAASQLIRIRLMYKLHEF